MDLPTAHRLVYELATIGVAADQRALGAESPDMPADYIVEVYGPSLTRDGVLSLVDYVKEHELDIGIDERGRIAIG
jgi:hypothetical protein